MAVTQVCAACHSVQQLHFRNLVDVAYTEDEGKTMAADIEVGAAPPISSPARVLPFCPAPSFVWGHGDGCCGCCCNGCGCGCGCG